MILYIRDFKGSTRECLEMVNCPKINETTKTPDSQGNLEPKNNARRITISELKLYFGAIVINTSTKTEMETNETKLRTQT